MKPLWRSFISWFWNLHPVVSLGIALALLFFFLLAVALAPSIIIASIIGKNAPLKEIIFMVFLVWIFIIWKLGEGYR